MIASTPVPPYAAVIFTSLRTEGDNGYAVMAQRMRELAKQQPGYLGIEAARKDLGITVSYCVDDAAAAAWKQVAEHLLAYERGRTAWYVDYPSPSVDSHPLLWPGWTSLTTAERRLDLGALLAEPIGFWALRPGTQVGDQRRGTAEQN